jgi:hypothetical protein
MHSKFLLLVIMSSLSFFIDGSGDRKFNKNVVNKDAFKLLSGTMVDENMNKALLRAAKQRENEKMSMSPQQSPDSTKKNSSGASAKGDWKGFA